MMNWNALQAQHDLNQAVWELDWHNKWATLLAGNSLAEFDVAYHRTQADLARGRVENARARLAPHIGQKEAA